MRAKVISIIEQDYSLISMIAFALRHHGFVTIEHPSLTYAIEDEVMLKGTCTIILEHSSDRYKFNDLCDKLISSEQRPWIYVYHSEKMEHHYQKVKYMKNFVLENLLSDITKHCCKD